MRKCDEWQLTFKSGAYLIRNGYGAVALYDFAQRKYLTRSSQKWMNVKQEIQFYVREKQYSKWIFPVDMLEGKWKNAGHYMRDAKTFTEIHATVQQVVNLREKQHIN